MYAIKVFAKRQGEVSPFFIQEQEAAQDLSHHHILKYKEFHETAYIKSVRGPAQECSAIVMEYIPYGDLFNMIAKEAFSDKLARTFFKQMISATEYLHKLGTAHLDIKPENFLISNNGIKLMDFDFSHKFNAKSRLDIKGTPGYRSPELAREELKNYSASDIYSLGVVLFTMIAGCPPYEELEENPEIFVYDKFYQALRKNVNQFWGTHNTFRSQAGKAEYSADFKHFFEQLLHEDPEKRPSLEDIKSMEWYNGEVLSEAELRDELKRYL
jgi:serine/threonine protein kinase